MKHFNTHRKKEMWRRTERQIKDKKGRQMAAKETERDRLRESRMNGEEEERDGLGAWRGRRGGRRQIDKGKREREKSILWQEYAPWRIKLQDYRWFSVLTGRGVSLLRKGLDSCGFLKVNSQSFVVNLLQSLEETRQRLLCGV